MNIDIIRTSSADKTALTAEGLSFSDSEKAEKLRNSFKSKITKLWLRKILTNLGEVNKSETRWDLSEDKKDLIVFHTINLVNESEERVQYIHESINHFIKCFVYYLFLLEDFSFSPSIDTLITDTTIFSSLNSETKEFIKDQIENEIAKNGYCKLTGFDFFTPNESDSLTVTPKEINNSTYDPNTVFTTRGVVIDFNYEELQFTLAIDEEENTQEASVEHSKTKMKFYFADDELLSANQEAYFHRYMYSPQPVITVHYVALPLGNFVCLDKMEVMDVRSP